MVFNFPVRIFFAVILTVASIGAIPDPVFRNVREKFVWGNESLPEASDRIHGGYFAGEGKLQFMVFLLIFLSENSHQALTCSGSIITEHWVLTAAHCVNRPNSFALAVAGKADLRAYITKRLSMPFYEDIDENSFGLQERRVFRAYVHPKYSTLDNSNDFALLLLERPFASGPFIRSSVQSIVISERKMTLPKSCMVAGWGLNEEDRQTFRLMFAEGIKAKPVNSCHYINRGEFLCLERGGPGICKGDSGGPLVCGGEIWGVASFAMSQNQNPSCLDQEEEYYAEIYGVLPWIRKTLEASSGSLNVRGVIGVFYLGLSFLWFLR